ncbi:hypothetical protein BMETH_2496_0 [methanotrophic bacterial endosymbiont of Bathymodiolus sp.]|nr:hypothetical protein BMETH_2496_0 [methanotrophic bacterial endosymbiont of Bathymodiolus sp.]
MTILFTGDKKDALWFLSHADLIHSQHPAHTVYRSSTTQCSAGNTLYFCSKANLVQR